MIDLAALRKVLRYDPATGDFVWLRQESFHSVAWNARHAGKIAGSRYAHRTGGKASGRFYTRIGIDGRNYFSHRLAWLYMTGEWPRSEVDHVNGCGEDNRWSNLRGATRSQNAHNQRLSASNKTGVKGVSWSKHRKKWVAHIRTSGRTCCLGGFKEISDAIAARREAEVSEHGDFAWVPQEVPKAVFYFWLGNESLESA